jgi:hypothetical protein
MCICGGVVEVSIGAFLFGLIAGLLKKFKNKKKTCHCPEIDHHFNLDD